MDCKCLDDSARSDKKKPGMAFVPWQHWGDIYEPCKALSRGTLFVILDKPFKGGRR